MKFEDLTGMKFGRLTVISRAPRLPSSPTTRWHCVCDCGGETTAQAPQLKSGKTQSCGCLASELSHERATTHGGRKTRLYHIWAMMKQRVLNPKNDSYKDYGGRGIRICDDWANSFVVFRDWAYKAGYSDSLSIDRINNDGNYEPSNCRWVDVAAQNRNQRSNVRLEYNGETKLMVEWAKDLGITEQALYRRINVLHWPLERALTQHKHKKG